MAGEARTGNIYVYIYYFINLIFMLLQNITKKKKKLYSYVILAL